VPLLEGSKIIASEDGIVKFIKEDSVKYGCSSKYNGKANYIVLSHEKEKKETLYLHLKKNSMKKYKIKVGQKVKKGQVIGEVGKSGFICGVHLHFQVQKKCNFW
jgi:murein DD-endopeptidase MepM/ murein hydrolase activator NlpD